MNKVLFSHKSDNWETPKDIYQIFQEKGFKDICPLDPNGSLAFFQDWDEKLFINPPYSEVERWVDRALACTKEIWLLLPSRTGSNWFRKLVIEKEKRIFIIFIRGRLIFSNKNSAPFDSLLVQINGPNIGIASLQNKLIPKYLEMELK